MSESRVSEVDGVPAAPLEAWLRERGLLATGDPAPLLTQLTGGSSNLTVRVESGNHDWVLRRPPVRGGLPNAHDMLREYRLQAALASARSGLPLATMVEACDDAEVIGAPFYVMDRLTGRVHTVESLSALPAATVHEVGLTLAGTLAQLHSIDPADVPAMAEFVRGEPYSERQLRRWSGQWQRARAATGLADEPALDQVFSELAATRPPTAAARVIHGDYGFANVMYDADEPTRVQAVLDWELTALGDPLADLGALVAYLSDMGRLLNEGRPDPVCHPDLLPALPTTAELVEHYVERSGPSAAGVDYLSWYVTLAIARMAVIVAGAFNRIDPNDPEGVRRGARTVDLIHRLALTAETELSRDHSRT